MKFDVVLNVRVLMYVKSVRFWMRTVSSLRVYFFNDLYTAAACSRCGSLSVNQVLTFCLSDISYKRPTFCYLNVDFLVSQILTFCQILFIRDPFSVN